MSGTPNKRLHEESGSNEYHLSSLPFEQQPGSQQQQDGRLLKVPRTESREVDRRSPLHHQLYRMPPSSSGAGGGGNNNDPSSYVVDHQAAVSSDNKVALESNRDANRDRDMYAAEPHHNVKSRGDDRDTHKTAGEVKTEKDSFHNSGLLNWKENREQQHRVTKRFPESAVDGIDAWRASRCNNLQATPDTGKDASTLDERGYPIEAYEAVGENRVDFRSDDKFKEKDRKKKEERHREWGERDKDRNDRRSNLQLGNSSSEHREMTREEREERWDRERKEIQKERERPKDKDKDLVKKETTNGMEKDGSQNEIEAVIRMPEQENPALELKRQKEFDTWKAADKDAKDRRKETDAELEGDRHEKRSRCYDKELDDGFMEGDGGADREREGFSSGVQQRKRMVRPRGSPQVANREPRFRSRSRENDESQEKSEMSTVVYKVGECMQELIKLWKEFEASQDNKKDENNLKGPTLEIRIPAQYVTAGNRQVKGGQLWGTDVYTDDSDLVAVLMHTGYCRPTVNSPPSAIQELRATIRVLPPQDCYTSTLRNNVRSRAWGAAIGCSYRVERCCIFKNGGGTIDLEPCLTHTSSVEPTLAPVAVERTMTTRAAASNALRQQRFVREVTIQYNLCNEPWIKYSISIVADKGLKKPLYTSARLKKGEVLYLETHSQRYELCFNGEKTVSQPMETETDKQQQQQNGCITTVEQQNNTTTTSLIDVFRLSRCKKPLPQKVMRSIGIPLPLDHVEVLEENVDWEDVQWSQTGVSISGKDYHIARVHFLSPN